jgi:hypothetical protein
MVVGVHYLSSFTSAPNFRDPGNFHTPEQRLGDDRVSGDDLEAAQPFSMGQHNCLGKVVLKDFDFWEVFLSTP